MKTISKSMQESHVAALRKGICLEFFSAYQEMELDRMMNLCDALGIVSFVPLGRDYEGKIHEIGKGVWTALMDAFPDLDNTVIDLVYLEKENTVTCNVDIFGTQKKNFAGLEAKGKRFYSEHIFIFQFTDEDKIKDIKVDWNHHKFVSQLS
ncbi:ester cyclase [Pararhodonellum marinum]|uniref:ester cyclase n=1 Tax=Pararhodonellum marinum TaxID=2755358 RepID=UPI00189052FE|nr:ester cyclase [Pararhodonellum marinum]